MLVGRLVQVVPQLLALVSQLEGGDGQGRGEFLISHSGSGSRERAGDGAAGGVDWTGVGPLVSLVLSRGRAAAEDAGDLSVELRGRLVSPALGGGGGGAHLSLSVI